MYIKRYWSTYLQLFTYSYLFINKYFYHGLNGSILWFIFVCYFVCLFFSHCQYSALFTYICTRMVKWHSCWCTSTKFSHVMNDRQWHIYSYLYMLHVACTYQNCISDVLPNVLNFLRLFSETRNMLHWTKSCYPFLASKSHHMVVLSTKIFSQNWSWAW